MRIIELSLVPIYLGHQPGLFEFLAARLAAIFDSPVRVHHPWFDPERSFDPSRSQYNSTHLLTSLLDHPPAGGEAKILGVTGVDLFVPVLTYVFGEAELGGRAAVVSLHRLCPEAYGLPPDPALLGERLLKEAVHELGHTLGLTHCQDSTCVMHPATYAEEIDLKSASFCLGCRDAAGLGRGPLSAGPSPYEPSPASLRLGGRPPAGPSPARQPLPFART
jgi:archaemetzincin